MADVSSSTATVDARIAAVMGGQDDLDAQELSRADQLNLAAPTG